jgi:hypothetical protein
MRATETTETMEMDMGRRIQVFECVNMFSRIPIHEFQFMTKMSGILSRSAIPDWRIPPAMFSASGPDHAKQPRPSVSSARFLLRMHNMK